MVVMAGARCCRGGRGPRGSARWSEWLKAKRELSGRRRGDTGVVCTACTMKHMYTTCVDVCGHVHGSMCSQCTDMGVGAGKRKGRGKAVGG